MPGILVSRRVSNWTALKEPTMLLVDPEEAPILIRVPSASSLADLLAAQNATDLDVANGGADGSATGVSRARSRHASQRFNSRSELLRSSDSFVLSPDEVAQVDEKNATVQQLSIELTSPTTTTATTTAVDTTSFEYVPSNDAKAVRRKQRKIPTINVTKPPLVEQEAEVETEAEVEATTTEEDVTLSFATVSTTNDESETLVEIVVVPETKLTWWQRNVSEPVMQRLHRFGAYWPTLFYALSQAYDQLWAILPILFYVVLFRLALLDHQALDNAGVVLLGLLSVVFGLFLFMEGLEFIIIIIFFFFFFFFFF